jgi:cytochrome c biogenesis protein CcmG/thiol:disulfide interchange protein DsbE
VQGGDHIRVTHNASSGILPMISNFHSTRPVRRVGQIAVAFAFVTLARPLMAQAGDGMAVGAAAPAVVVLNAAGKSVTVTPTLGHPMLIEFWATWCEFCERLEPTMKTVYGKYGNKVQFAAIAVNVNQTPRRVAKHVQDRTLKYPVYYDESGKAVSAYDVAATSFVVIIGKDGKVAYTGVGDKQDLDSAIKEVLKKALKKVPS